ncbi:MAG: hypothetical protein KDI65_04040 [Alphaproteobacteria bacterium]|nr:hypothetical protein [Alphaproteobacteria bacterium]
MPIYRKTLLAASLMLLCAASGTALAHDNDHKNGPWNNSTQNRNYGYHDTRKDDHHRDYGWDDHDNHDRNDWNNRKYDNKDWNHNNDRGGNHDWRNDFQIHVPSYLKNTRKVLPLLIVVDNKGTYRGVPTHKFFQQKAGREGLILAYAYGNGYGRHDDNAIIRSVLSLLDSHYRVDTRRINVYYN